MSDSTAGTLVIVALLPMMCCFLLGGAQQLAQTVGILLRNGGKLGLPLSLQKLPPVFGGTDFMSIHDVSSERGNWFRNLLVGLLGITVGGVVPIALFTSIYFLTSSKRSVLREAGSQISAEQAVARFG